MPEVMEDYRVAIVRQILGTAQTDVLHGQVALAAKDIAAMKGFAAQLDADSQDRITADALVAKAESELATIATDGALAQSRLDAAAAASNDNEAAVAGRNSDPSYFAAAQRETDDIRAGQEAQRLGLNVNLAYGVGLGAAQALKSAEDVAGALKFPVLILAGVAVALAVVFIVVRFGR